MKSFLSFALLSFSILWPTVTRAETSVTLNSNQVSVTFVDPEKFTDFNTDGYGSASDKDIKYLTDLFTEHLGKLARRFLTEGERLEITFTDIDLAGRFEPERGPNAQNIRIYRDITFPRMVFSFRHLAADGSVISENQRKLTDLNYNIRLRLPGGDDELRPDRELLTDWMGSEFKRQGN